MAWLKLLPEVLASESPPGSGVCEGTVILTTVPSLGYRNQSILTGIFFLLRKDEAVLILSERVHGAMNTRLLYDVSQTGKQATGY